MALYFFNFHPNQISNLYVKLAKRIAEKNWNGAFATLNYELMLERSLLYAGLKINIIDEPAASDQLELCYPHGCCHLFCESVRGMASSVSFDGYGVRTKGIIKKIVDRKEYQDRIINE